MTIRSQVLVVDDETNMRDLLREALEARELEVVLAASGEEALRLFDERPAELVLLDIFMPGLSGLAVLKELRARSEDVQVVMLSANTEIAKAVAAMRAGAFDYIEKPWDLDRLYLSIDRALERSRLASENRRLRRLTDRIRRPPEIVTKSPKMLAVLELIDRVAATDSTVLVEGESGTGKELVAQRLHLRSARARAPFIALNCGTLQGQLLESELFGHEKGAFTGANDRHLGLFDAADGGTIFLDEIGEMGVDLQVKLLRVLQTGEFRPLGANRAQHADVRVIAATNRVLADEVRSGGFREDLYYRLNVIQIPLPPLRERPEDIELLARHFLQLKRPHGLALELGKEAARALRGYRWPGNVRELENVMERVSILAQGEAVGLEDLPAAVFQPPPPSGAAGPYDPSRSIADIERDHIQRVLAAQSHNKVQTARVLGINVKTLYNKIKQYQLGKDGT